MTNKNSSAWRCRHVFARSFSNTACTNVMIIPISEISYTPSNDSKLKKKVLLKNTKNLIVRSTVEHDDILMCRSYTDLNRNISAWSLQEKAPLERIMIGTLLDLPQMGPNFEFMRPVYWNVFILVQTRGPKKLWRLMLLVNHKALLSPACLLFKIVE